MDINDISASVGSLYRDTLQRRNMLIWRDHRRPAVANRLPNADSNYNNGKHRFH